MSGQTHLPNAADALLLEAATHRIIEFVDTLAVSEPAKYAAMLAATYSQKHFMLEHSTELAAAVPIIEQMHEETMEGLRRG